MKNDVLKALRAVEQDFLEAAETGIRPPLHAETMEKVYDALHALQGVNDHIPEGYSPISLTLWQCDACGCVIADSDRHDKSCDGRRGQRLWEGIAEEQRRTRS